ncbi:Uncharacterised protein [Mycobacterium tuberculosis]|nr:Uncharacterised protein [Mycobacterium tuberculosis]
MLWKSHIHVWYITICVGKKNTVSCFFVYKVNVFSLKVTKSVKVFFQSRNKHVFTRFVNTDNCFKHDTSSFLDKLTK